MLNPKKKVHAKRRPDYYQGILQLREVTEEMTKFLYNQLKKRPDVSIAKTVKFSNGMDFYASSNQFIISVGKKLKESFGGELKTSSKLHTRNKQGKELYRVNVFFKPLKHRKGDIVCIRGDDIRILSIGKKIFGRYVNTGRKCVIRTKDF